MNPTLPSFFGAARGIWTLTWRAKLARKRIFLVIGSMTALPLLSAYIGYKIGFAVEELFHFHNFLVQLYLLLVVPLFCLSNFGSMIRDELQEDTMSFLITRPVSRAKLFLLKYFALAAWLQIIVLGNALAFWLVGVWLGIPDAASLIALLAAVQFLAVLAFGALAALIGLITQKYLVAGIVYGFIVEFGIGRIPTNINVLSISRHLKTFLAWNSDLVSRYQWDTEGTWFSLIMVLVGTALFLLIGALLFTFKECQHAEEMQKGA